jgi:Fe/S biogenesis protein NfuA
MIQISDTAQTYFRRLIQQQDGGFIGIRLSAMRAGTPSADARLEFCDRDDLDGNEWAVECDGFTLYVEGASVPYFDGADIDFAEGLGGGQVSIKAPRIKGGMAGGEGSIFSRVQQVLDREVNPQLAAHGGRVSVEEITAENAVVLRFGGGCHGCGMVDTTLRQGVEVTLRQQVPEISAVIDATDHDSGSNPYFQRQA